MVLKRNFISATTAILTVALTLTISLSTSVAAPMDPPVVSNLSVGDGQIPDTNGTLPFAFSVNHKQGALVNASIECGTKSFTKITVLSSDQGNVVDDTYQVRDLDTSSGGITVNTELDTKSVADDIDTKTFQCQVIATDGINITKAVILSDIKIDNLDPEPNEDATIQIENDQNGDGIVAIGDTFSFTKGTENTKDDVVWSMDTSFITGGGELISGQESDPVIEGPLDMDGPASISVKDDMGNEFIANTSNSLSIDQIRPEFSSTGILSITTDHNSNGIAETGDGITLTGVTLSADDGDTIIVDLSEITGEAKAEINTEYTIIKGHADGDFSFKLTAIDNAGNTAFDYTNEITVNNTAPVTPPTIQFDTTSSTIAESDGTATFTVNIDKTHVEDVTVDYIVSGTANNGSDFELSNGKATIAAGEIETDINFGLIDDTAVEADETIIITISHPSGAELGANDTYTFTLTSEDVAAIVEFDTTSSTIAESDKSATFTVSLDRIDDSDITVDYTVTGTATRDSDYTLADGTLTITAGDTTSDKKITLINDKDFEADETIIITLSNPSGADLGANDTYTFTLTSDDAAPKVTPEIGFSSTSSTVSENAGSLAIAVSTSANVETNTPVTYAVTGGTASSEKDYILAKGTVTIATGTNSKTFEVQIVDDKEYEEAETIIIQLSAPKNANLNENTIHTVTITDDDTKSSGTSSSGSSTARTNTQPTTTKDTVKQNVSEKETVTTVVVIDNVKSEPKNTETNVKADTKSNQDDQEVHEIKVVKNEPIKLDTTNSSPNTKPEIQNHWAEKELSALIELKVVSSDTTPDKKLRRADVIKAALDSAGFEVESDIDQDTAYTEAAKELKIVDQDRKEDPATRAEALQIVLKALGIDIQAPTQKHFEDTTQNDWFYNLVNFAFEKGIIIGYEDGTFKPNQEISAAEIAKIVAKATALAN